MREAPLRRGAAPVPPGPPAWERPAPAPRRQPPVPRRHNREWVRWAAIALAGVLALAAVGVAVALQYAGGLLKQGETEVEGLARALDGPRNFLLVGSDSREGLSQRDLDRLQTAPEAGKRTDSIMILHVSPTNQKAVMVSIPRDTVVTLDGETRRINAFFNDGPTQMVRAVRQLTGLEIHHYVEVNFAGFLGVVNALGGVELCNNTGKRLDDNMANLHMDPGCHKMNGYQALAFVRARHATPRGDLDRAERQQHFIRQVLKKLTATGTLANPSKLLRVANQLSQHVHFDQNFNVRQAVELAQQFRALAANPEQVDMRVLPTAGRPSNWCGRSDSGSPCPAYQDPTIEASLLMRAIAQDAKELPAVGLPGGRGLRLRDVRLEVRNGSDVQGLGSRAAQGLTNLGVRVVGPATNHPEKTNGTSLLLFNQAQAQQALLLQYLLGPQVKLQRSDQPLRQMVLVVDASYQVVGAPAGGGSQ